MGRDESERLLKEALWLIADLQQDGYGDPHDIKRILSAAAVCLYQVAGYDGSIEQFADHLRAQVINLEPQVDFRATARTLGEAQKANDATKH